jgi:erythronate-4-phosphate dehydrogenase
MRIVADENIPLLMRFFGTVGDIVLKPGRDIKREDLLKADALIVRAVTKVDEKLLQDTKIKFVGSVTTGTDHLAIPWLDEKRIAWYTAYGCNTTAVVEYVIAVIASLQKNALLADGKNLRAGVIGVGQIGRWVVDKLQILGFDVLTCDPYRAMTDKDFVHTPIEDFHDLDFVTLHTPLTREGEFPTFHLIAKKFLQQQKNNCVLLNASRGAVINSADLLEFGEHLIWCLDVFENEPIINLDILPRCFIATPHIAGYSVQSKYRGVEMVYKAAAKFFDLPPYDMGDFPKKAFTISKGVEDWRDQVLKIYNPQTTTDEMKKLITANGPANAFDEMRKHFNQRYEFAYTDMGNSALGEQDISLLKLLNFTG